MRTFIFLFCLLCLPISVRAEYRVPPRKPGLWEITIESSAPGSRTQSVKQCVDSSSDEALMQGAAALGEKAGVRCSKNEMKESGGAYLGSSECTLRGTKIFSSSAFRGDFDVQYSGTITSSYDPPLFGAREVKTSISARRLGPCPGQ